MDLPKRPGSREALIDYLLQPDGGISITRPTLAPPAASMSDSSASSAARAPYDAMSGHQINELVAKKRQHEDEAAKARLAEEAKALAAKQDEEDRALFFNQPNAAADFRYWGKMACWKLDEAIALSLGKNPHVVNAATLFGDTFVSAAHTRSWLPGEYARRREFVRRASSMHALWDPISPKEFLAWAQPVFDWIPPELFDQVGYTAPTQADVQRLTARISELESELSSSAEAAQHRWPWGPYETDLLRKLAAAASKFWVRYDPADATTAPTNDQVVSWLEKEGLSKNIATAMATILRADGIAPGPRK